VGQARFIGFRSFKGYGHDWEMLSFSHPDVASEIEMIGEKFGGICGVSLSLTSEQCPKSKDINIGKCRK
jgi:hypothetical protein